VRNLVRLFLPLLLLSTGCVHLATQEEKEASFRPYLDVHVGAVPLRDFLEARTAVLVAGAEPLEVVTEKDEVGVKLKPADPDGAVDVGSASALSADGYYLTAAHCVHRTPVFLVIPTPAGPQAYPARIVWKSPDSSTDCDLAILKIHVAPPALFDIAPPSALQIGDVVVTSGANGEAAGHLLTVNAEPASNDGSTPAFLELIHDVPLTHGDSGGPLILLDGRLIGVEVLVRGSYLTGAHGVALLPDAEWLTTLIAKDRTSR
jgi:S1-C subfamily serine protease